MKKITLLFILLTTYCGYAQDPATGPVNPPARNAGDVKSIYNGIAAPVAPEYTNEPSVIFDSFGGTTIVGQTPLADGNNVFKYTSHNYSGIRAGAGDLDVSSMTMLHIDVYSPTFTSFRIKLESTSAGSPEIEVLGAKTQNSWNSYDIDLSQYASSIDLAHLKWIVPVTANGGVPNVTMYIDNVYFYRPAASTVATLSDLKVDGTTITGFASGKINYSVVLPKGTTVIPQITAVTKTNSLATETITQASALPGDATVVVVSEDASTTKTYTVSFSVDTSTPCAGTSKEAREGTFSAGYNYTVETLPGGTSVKYTITVLDTDKPGLCCGQLHAILPDVYVNMSNTTGQTYVGTVTGLTNGQVISYAGRFPYAAGGLVETKLLQYTVGDACALGTDKFEASSVKMYPNPVKNTLTIDANGSIDRVSVYNILGQEVLKSSPKSNSVTLQTNELQKGVYMVTTEIDGNVSTSKVIKE